MKTIYKKGTPQEVIIEFFSPEEIVESLFSKFDKEKILYLNSIYPKADITNNNYTFEIKGVILVDKSGYIDTSNSFSTKIMKNIFLGFTDEEENIKFDNFLIRKTKTIVNNVIKLIEKEIPGGVYISNGKIDVDKKLTELTGYGCYYGKSSILPKRQLQKFLLFIDKTYLIDDSTHADSFLMSVFVFYNKFEGGSAEFRILYSPESITAFLSSGVEVRNSFLSFYKKERKKAAYLEKRIIKIREKEAAVNTVIDSNEEVKLLLNMYLN